MFSYYIDKAGNYYEGDRIDLFDDEVPKRPDANHGWNGSAWEPLPAPIPEIVSPRQLRQALNRAHLRAPVEAAIVAGDQDLKDWWEFATEFKRHHPMVIAMAASLGVSDEALDELFRVAATL